MQYLGDKEAYNDIIGKLGKRNLSPNLMVDDLLTEKSLHIEKVELFYINISNKV